MITLQEVFDTLAAGSLSNLSIGQSQFNTIDESNYPKVISNINLGLVDLSCRFNLKQNERRIFQVKDKTVYYIREEYSEETYNCGTSDYYVEVTDENPWKNDLIKILEVYNSAENVIPLNDKTKFNSVFTLEFDTLKMIPSDPVEIVTVKYQAHYPPIVIKDNFDPNKVYINIPRQLLEPLCLFVTSKLTIGINSSVSEGEQNPNSTFYYKYIYACKQIENLNLMPEDNESNNKLYDRGFE